MSETFGLRLHRAPAPSKSKKKTKTRRESVKLLEATRPKKHDDNSSSDESNNKIGSRAKPSTVAKRTRGDSIEWLSTQKIRKDERIFDFGPRRDAKSAEPNRSSLRDAYDSKPRDTNDEFEFSGNDDESNSAEWETPIGRGQESTPISMGRSAKKQQVRQDSVDKYRESFGDKQSRSTSSSEDNSDDDVQLLHVTKSTKPSSAQSNSLPKQNHFIKQTKPNCKSSSSSDDDDSPQEAQIGKASKKEKQRYASSGMSSRKSSGSHGSSKQTKSCGYENGSDSSSSQEEVEVFNSRKGNKQKNRLKKRTSMDRQSHSDYKVARSRAEALDIPKQLASPSELRWYKTRQNRDGKFELKICPCRVLSSGEARRVIRNKGLESKNGAVAIQFLIGYKYAIVDDTTLFPFSEEGSTDLDKPDLNSYTKYLRSKGVTNVNVETQKLFLVRVFEHAQRTEADAKTRDEKDLDDYYGESGHGVPCDDVELKNTPEDGEMEVPAVTFKQQVGEHDDASDDEALEIPRPIFEEEKLIAAAEEEEPIDEEFFDCPYTQAMNFDPDSNDLDEEVSNEPMRSGDVIEYYSPIFVVGDKRGLRQATVLAVTPGAVTILHLSNGEYLPEDTRVKRIKVMDGDELFDHPGIYRPIDNFKLIKGKVKGGASGIMNEAARFGDIFRKNISKMQARAEADGFAPMDMLRNMPGGCKRRNGGDSPKNRSPPLRQRKESSSHQSTSSSAYRSADESPKKRGPCKSPQFGTSCAMLTPRPKPSPKSLKRAIDASEQPRRRTTQAQALCDSSSTSSSDESAGQTLTEIARKKHVPQEDINLKTSEKRKSSALNKENICNSYEEKKRSTTHTNSPAPSLGPSFASSSPSLGSSFASSSSSSEDNANGASSKYCKLNNGALSTEPPSAINLSVDMSSQSSKSSSDEASKNTVKRTPASLSRRNPLSEDDISDFDDEADLRIRHASFYSSRHRGFESKASFQRSWTKDGPGWKRSEGSMPFSRHK